jgi:RND family efflux transporter MFP subunit
MDKRHFITALLLVAAAASGACGGKNGQAHGAPPPMPVEAVTLAPKPVEQVTEFVGVVKSRRSTLVQPMVEGFITKIMVKSGDTVRPGAALLTIDAGMQRAAVANMESQRAARAADLQYAQQQAERMKKLVDAGASSQSELEQAQTALATSEAQLRASEAATREQRVSLNYYRVTSPTAGVVGDIPVRVGDSVKRDTVLTTVDQNGGLEVYISVPVKEAGRLKEGLAVHLVDDDGKKIGTEKITFVSPSVDPATQSVLAKAALSSQGNFRTEQFVRAQVVWNQEPSLTVPVTSVVRINGQYFAYVVDAAGGKPVAHQRAVELGTIVGNDYIVRSGLKAGEQLVVTGIQKIGDGAPVSASSPAPPPENPKPPAAAAAENEKGE